MIDPSKVTTIRVGELPPGAFALENKIPHEIGTDLFHGTIGDLINFIAPLISAIQFEIKTLHVDSLYIAENFDETGLGINLMVGYAIVNGNNGTINKDGRVGIAYGTVTNVIGQVGGETTHLLTGAELPSHTHAYDRSVNDNGDPGNFVITSPNNGGGSGAVVSSASGGGTPHNNMQPYLVELQVMKL
jgi:hypothetical protein